MKNILLTLLLATSMISCASSNAVQTKPKLSHIHMGHVSTKWNDTPEQAGLLPTAMKEAKIAAKHATLATRQLDNLTWMKLHTTHVVNALDPTIVAKGPGTGYGLIKAAKGVVKHINLAASSPDASPNVKIHATHIATSANNSVLRAQQILKLAEKMKKANSPAQAAPIAQRIQSLTQQIIDGYDANGDGTITWVKGEGGLKEAQKHLGIMQKGEGMAAM